MKKIAILGTCASEDWYHHQNARRRLDVKLAPPYQQSALLSLNAKPVSLPQDLGMALSEGEIAKLRADFGKTFLSTLCEVRPDYLIVDLLLDSRRGVFGIDGSLVTNSYIIQRSSLRDSPEFRASFNPVEEPIRYLEEFTNSVRFLGAFLKTRLPDCRVILHKARWAEYFLDKNGDLHPFKPPVQLNHFVANMRIRKLEEVFETEIACDSIQVQNTPVIADAQHIWGFLPVHYQKDYYKEFNERLRPLIER